MIINGLHHITAICGNAQANIAFYTGVLGLRLVKVTVNFDDPGSYHLYYGNERGAPGTCLTFFAWPQGAKGEPGVGQATAIGFSVPYQSVRFWEDRLNEDKIETKLSPDKTQLTLQDPDGIELRLIEADDPREAWLPSGIGTDAAVRGFHTVYLSVGRADASVRVLEKMGFTKQTANTNRLGVGDQRPGKIVELIPSAKRSLGGVGTIHHVAFATPTDDTQTVCAYELSEIGVQPTTVQEREYFRSIYFRESSGVLYEIATSGPGFAVDEPVESLGSRLCLPPWLEKFRDKIESSLPKILTPGGVRIPDQTVTSA
jgi:glyoxalase family protein